MTYDTYVSGKSLVPMMQLLHTYIASIVYKLFIALVSPTQIIILLVLCVIQYVHMIAAIITITSNQVWCMHTIQLSSKVTLTCISEAPRMHSRRIPVWWKRDMALTLILYHEVLHLHGRISCTFWKRLACVSDTSERYLGTELYRMNKLFLYTTIVYILYRGGSLKYELSLVLTLNKTLGMMVQ